MSFLNSREALAPRGIGKSVARREDSRLLTGRGRYAEDFSLPGQAYACLVRSPHAHASIARIDATAAIGCPGVLTVLTGSDAASDGLRPIPHSPVPANPHEVPLRNRDGSGFFIAPHPVLAEDAVRYVGEPVAVVVAETLAEAVDAAERVDVVYKPLAAVARSQDALAPGAPPVWAGHGSNLCIDSEAGDRNATEDAFACAAHVVRLQTTINRVTGVPMELRAALGAYDAAAAQFTVCTSAGGGVIRQRDDIAGALGVAKHAVRVISGDVGGNFGIRNNTCPEFVLVAWAAKRVGRPVKWVCDRRDAFLTDFHGRDLTSKAELALDQNGNFLALRAVNISNLGASAISFVPLAKGIAVSSSVYHIPVSHMRGLGVVTNTAPTSAYRSAGRPEVMFVLERMIDIACRRHGFDRVALRQQNLVPPDAMPYRNPLGLVYDSGDYPASLRRAAELGDWAGFAARRAEARGRGRCRGIGIAASIELNTGGPRERAEMTIHPAGIVELVLGTMSAGQGHETSFAQVVSEWLGVDPEQVRLVTGDTDRVGRRRLGFGAIDAARVLGDGHRRRSDRREGAPHRGRHARSVGSGCRVRRTAFCSEGHRPLDRAVRGRRRRLGRCRSARTARVADRRRRPGHEHPVLRLYLRGMRGGDRPGDRLGRGRRLRLDRRLRPGGKPDADPRPEPWRHRARYRTGAVGGMLL